jgi:hypothetical protein
MIKSLEYHNTKFHTFGLLVRWNVITEEVYRTLGAMLGFFATEGKDT